MKKNILICTDSMGIGGVETAIYNQITAMIKKGHNVILASTGGIYIDKVKSIGATIVNFEFSLENNFNFNKIEEMINIIEMYDINEIHIEKFMCILTMFPVCIIKNIPYVAYIHDELNISYEWYTYHYDIYLMLFKEFFKYANKIIAIKQSVIDYTSQRFSIDKSKYKLISNSINFTEYKSNKSVKGIENFLIVSRLDSEKENSVKNAIDFFILFCKKTNKNMKLSILGSGNILNNIENYINEVNKDGYQITFLGSTSEVCSIIDNYDVILGMGRCIIEAIAMKKIAIVSGYDKINGLVSEQNFSYMLKTNFNGEGLKIDNIDIINQLEEMNVKEIENLVNQNYKLAFSNINIDDNIFIIRECEESLIKTRNLLEEISIVQNKYLDKKKEAQDFENKVYELREICDKQYNQIEDLYKKLQEKDQEVIKKIQEKDQEVIKKIEKIEEVSKQNELLSNKNRELKKLNEILEDKNLTLENEKYEIQHQLDSILNSRRWKLLNKIFKKNI